MKNLLYFIIPLSFLVMSSCGGDPENKTSSDINDKEVKEKTTNENQSSTSSFSWDNIPVYPNAALETTEDCPAKWSECEKCEHRIYFTDDDPNDVCSFYKDAMKKKGWKKNVFQMYPEGSCMGSWLSADSNVRVFFNAAQRRNDKKTFIAITMGQNCPD